MLKILLLSLFIFCAQLINAQTYNSLDGNTATKPYSPSQAIPTDGRSYYYDSANFVWRPFKNIAEALAYFPISKNRVGVYDIIINTGGTYNAGIITGGVNDIYTFKNGIADSNLVFKSLHAQQIPGLYLVYNALTGKVDADTQNLMTIGSAQIVSGDKYFTGGFGIQGLDNSDTTLFMFAGAMGKPINKKIYPSTIGASPFNLTSNQVTTALGYTPQAPFGPQAPNTVLAGPVSGSAATPTFRTLTVADIPGITGNYVEINPSTTQSGSFNINGTGTVNNLVTSLETISTSLSMLGPIVSNNNEGMKIANDAGRIDGYRTDGITQTGYLQFDGGHDVSLEAVDTNQLILAGPKSIELRSNGRINANSSLFVDDTFETNGTVILNLGGDAQGDMYYRDDNQLLARLPAGSLNYVLTQGGAGPIWEPASYPIGFDPGTNFQTVTGDFSVVMSHARNIINVNAATATITLPNPTNLGPKNFVLIRTNQTGQTVTVTTIGGQIETSIGVFSNTTTVTGMPVTGWVSDGTNWRISL
jgi:hypothetical protein